MTAFGRPSQWDDVKRELAKDGYAVINGVVTEVGYQLPLNAKDREELGKEDYDVIDGVAIKRREDGKNGSPS